MKPWLKITFDPNWPGEAKILRPGRKRPVTVEGRWVVFDKGMGHKPVLFDAATFEECCEGPINC
jgi:hypothetical protein